jgi:TRAP-type uncharacterized transport system fused permease subunit
MDKDQTIKLEYTPEQIRSDRKKFFGRLDIRLSIIFFSLSLISFLTSAGINFFVLHRYDAYDRGSGGLHERVNGKWVEVEKFSPTRLDPIITAVDASTIVLFFAGVISFTSYPWFKKKNTKYTLYDRIVR